MIIRDQGSQNEKEWVIQILQKNQAKEHPQMFDSSLEKKKRFWKLTEPMEGCGKITYIKGST